MLAVNVKKLLGERGKNHFVLDLAFTVGKSLTVLTGASGSGKTTTLRLIAGILQPDAGTIRVGERVFFDSEGRVNLSIQARRVGFVFQHYALFPHLTAGRNIAYGIKEADKKIKAAKVARQLALFRIEHLKNRLPRELSGGEQQRVALARALACEPAILLLDEPLSAVDVSTRAPLLDEIEAAQRRAQIPFVYVTHHEEEAARLATQRIILENGRIVESRSFD